MSGVNFNLIEDPNYTEKFWEEYEKIKNDVIDGFSTKEILEKYNLTHSGFRKYRKELQKEGVIGEEKIAKYYCQIATGKWVVRKYIDGRKTYFGTYETKEDAQKMVEELKKARWNKNKVNQIRGELGI